MTRMHMLTAAAALSLFCAPAIAQTVAANPPASQMTAAAEASAANAAACTRMIKQLNTALPSLNAARRNEAKKHMDVAKTALEQHDAAACVSNMQTAMNVLK